MNEQELERLVDHIARAVRARLGMDPVESVSPAASASSALAGEARVCSSPETCGDHEGANCATCALRVQQLFDAGASRIGAHPGTGSLHEQVARTIDHTMLKPEASSEEVRQLCEEARQYHFASVCVNAAHVPLCHRMLAGTGVKVVAVVGFPLGATLPAVKAYEACEAVRQGAEEIDMVLNIGALKDHDYQTVADDIRAVVEASRPAPVKVILETSKLTDEEKVAASAISKMAGAAFVKTSTGFGGGGATVEDVALMRRVVGSALGVKASGGVRTLEDASAMLKAGATRIGASASVAIVSGKEADAKSY